MRNVCVRKTISLPPAQYRRLLEFQNSQVMSYKFSQLLQMIINIGLANLENVELEKANQVVSNDSNQEEPAGPSSQETDE